MDNQLENSVLPDQQSAMIQSQTASKAVSRSQVETSITQYCAARTESALRMCKSIVTRWLSQTTAKYALLFEKYNVLYLMTDRVLKSMHSDRIYQSISQDICDANKPVLLILQSYGGRIEPAYFIGKMLRRFTNVEVAVPRMAKSAASLICCSASHIHMGGLSELGPIDPQVDGVPALGLKNAIQHLAELSGKYPDAVNLFIGYMCKRVEPMALGYYERVVESSMQYAERLLTASHPNSKPNELKLIAQKLTYDYKDHGFVIDHQEAADVFPCGMILSDTDEYKFSDLIYKEVAWMKSVAKSCGFDFSLVGCGVDALRFENCDNQKS